MANSRRLPQLTKSNLEKCRAAAIAAVDSYNRPGPRFRAALFVVLIIMAWQAFFHAYFYKQKRKPWYHTKLVGKGRRVRYEKVDGEPKHWDLKKCLAEYFGNNNPPARENLKFLLGLRNKIEHRNLPDLDPTLYGECQAALMNLEEFLVRDFGGQYGLEGSLSLSLQFSRTSNSEKKRAIVTLARSAKTVLDYIKEFRGGLNDQILNDFGYSFRVFLVPKVVNHGNSADASVEFVHLNQADEEQKRHLDQLNVLIKEKQIPVANFDKKKPSHVVETVSAAIKFDFKIHHHTAAWKHFNIRPDKNSNHPNQTKEQYCIYDYPHKDYLYTQAWIDKLIKELSDKEKFFQITGKRPQLKSSVK